LAGEGADTGWNYVGRLVLWGVVSDHGSFNDRDLGCVRVCRETCLFCKVPGEIRGGDDALGDVGLQRGPRVDAERYEERRERLGRDPRAGRGPDQLDAVRPELVEPAEVVRPLRDPFDHLVRGGRVRGDPLPDRGEAVVDRLPRVSRVRGARPRRVERAVHEPEFTRGLPLPYLRLPDPVRRSGEQVLAGGLAVLGVEPPQHRAPVLEPGHPQDRRALVLVVVPVGVGVPPAVEARGMGDRGECGPAGAQLLRVVQVNERHQVSKRIWNPAPDAT
jgi:hypothetical protein